MAFTRIAGIALAAACAALWIAATGCGGGEEPTESGTPAAAAPEKGSRQVTLPSGGEELQVANVTAGEMPGDFPDDIPTPEGAEPQMSMFIPGQGGMAVFLSSAPRNDLSDFFAQGLAGEGWDVDDPSEEEIRTVIKASKGSRTANVIVADGPDGSEIMVSVEGS